ncbi:MAG: histidine phosphatase family protein [Candidatus Falkowbacteria bacterium]
MLNIYLARHGQDEDNANGILNGHRDTSLTTLGLEQAQNLADEIKKADLNFDAIYSSPLKRTYKTAEIIATTIGDNNVKIIPDLIERDFGVMTGKRVSEIEKLCAPDIIKTDMVMYFLKPDKAETFPRLLERARVVLANIKKQYKNGNILLVTSGDIGKMIYAAYYNLDWKKVLQEFHFGNTDLLILSSNSGSINHYVVTNKQYNA